jgi:RecA/RadA recombinase
MARSHGANHGRADEQFLVSCLGVSIRSPARGPWLTQDLVVSQQDRGEPQEDTMESLHPAGGWLDAEIDDSFPASDPLSHWAGPRRRESEADRAHRPAMVHAATVDDRPEHRQPDEPMSGP